MTLFEMMQNAQNGQAMQNLARQYGLSSQQTQSALEALLPAFTIGLQRQTQDPSAFGSLAQMMAANPFARLYDSDGDGIPDQAQALGTNALAQIFGSREVSNAVTAQAAATSGVAQAVLKQMLPVIASMVMGGLFKSMSSQGLGGIFGQLTEAMRGGMPGQAKAPAPTPANPLEQILGGIFGNAPAPQQQPGQAPGGPFGGGQAGANPLDGGIFGQILEGMMGAGQPARPETREAPRPATAPQPDPQPQATGPAGPGSLGLDALNEMFQTGRRIQSDHQSALESIFDAFTGKTRR